MTRKWEPTVEWEGTTYHLCEAYDESWPDYFVNEDWSLAWEMGETYGPTWRDGPHGKNCRYISKGTLVDISDIDEDQGVVIICDTHSAEHDMGR